MKQKFLTWMIKRFFLPLLERGFQEIAPHYWKYWETEGIPDNVESKEMSFYLTEEGSVMVRCRFTPSSDNWDISEQSIYFPFRVLFSEIEMKNFIATNYGGNR